MADSTQELVLARSHEESGLVVWTTDQRAGKGRLQRAWISPKDSGVAVSLLLHPATRVARDQWTWFSLLLSCAAADVLRSMNVAASVKWPNDVMVGPKKIGGVLATASGSALVLGVGLNTSMTLEQRPEERATSIALEGASASDDESLVGEVLNQFSLLLDQPNWPEIYRKNCLTLGRPVKVMVPNDVIVGEAVDVTETGALIVRSTDGDVTINVGDVTHLR